MPFFLAGGAARCGGRGELVTPLAVPPPGWPLLLVKPPFGVATPWAYRAYAAASQPAAADIPGGGRDAASVKLDGWTLVNDLEPPVFRKFVILAELKRWLAGQPESRAALMSGSGSTVFAVLAADADHHALAGRVAAEYGDTFQCLPTRIAQPAASA